MTITVTGDDDVLEQIEKQLGKLIDVKEIVELPHDESVCRELVLIKVLCTREERQQITTMADIYRANIVDVAKNSLIISLTGSQSKIHSSNYLMVLKLQNSQELVSLVLQEALQV